MENMLFLALVEYYDQTVIQSKFVLLINQVPIFTQNKKKKQNGTRYMACHQKLHYRKILLSLSLFFASRAILFIYQYMIVLFIIGLKHQSIFM